MKNVLVILAIVSANCGMSSVYTSYGKSTPVSMTSVSGNYVRMSGEKITVVSDGKLDQEMVDGSIAWINEQIGFELLTKEEGGVSTIYITEGILPYVHPDDLEIFGQNGYDRPKSILGRASFDVPISGVINRCDVTVNYFIPGPRVRRDTLRHEVLHCLGLRDSEDWRNVMNGDLAGFRPPITEDAKNHLRSVYGG